MKSQNRLLALLGVFAFAAIGLGLILYYQALPTKQGFPVTGGTVSTPGLVAYYQFDGNAHDATVNNNNGTVYQWSSSSSGWGPTTTATVTVPNPAYETGKKGQALKFNGTGLFVKAPPTTSLAVKGAMTISAWIKKGSGTNFQAIAAGNAISYFFGLNSGKKTSLLLDKDGSSPSWDLAQVINSSALNADWTYVAATFSTTPDSFGNRAEIYFNGVRKKGDPGNPGNIFVPTTGKNALTIGGAYPNGISPNYWFDGALDELKIYNRALTEADIKSEYCQNSPTSSICQTTTSSSAATTSGSATTTSVPSGPYAIDLTPNPEVIPADGKSKSKILAIVSDIAKGTPVQDVEVAFTTDNGTLSDNQVKTNATGQAETELTSSNSNGMANVTATVGIYNETISVEFEKIPSPTTQPNQPSQPSSPWTLVSTGGKIGLIILLAIAATVLIYLIIKKKTIQQNKK